MSEVSEFTPIYFSVVMAAVFMMMTMVMMMIGNVDDGDDDDDDVGTVNTANIVEITWVKERLGKHTDPVCLSFVAFDG